MKWKAVCLGIDLPMSLTSDLFTGVFREATTDFNVDARALSKAGGPHVKTRVSNPSGNFTEAYVQDNGDGTYKVEYTPYEEGKTFFFFLVHF